MLPLISCQIITYEVGSESNASYFLLLGWPTTSEADGGSTEVEASHQCPFTFCCYVTGGSRGAIERTVSDIETYMKQRGVNESLHVE